MITKKTTLSILSLVLIFFVFAAVTGSFGAQDTVSNAALSAKLDQVLHSQQQILKEIASLKGQLQAVQAQLHIVKIRASR